MIYRGTTPTITIRVRDKLDNLIDLSEHNVYLTLECGKKSVNISNSRMTFNADKSISVTLTQAETLTFTVDTEIQCQIRAVKNNKAIASTIVEEEVGEILKEGEIE